MKKIWIFPLMAMAGMFFIGCITMPLDNRLMIADIPVMEHAVLCVQQNMNNVYIDGDDPMDGRAPRGILSAREPIIPLAPGIHDVTASYMSVSEGTYTTTTTTTGFMTITYDFQAGHRYYLYPEEQGNTISLRIIDETGATSGSYPWGKRTAAVDKKLPKAKYPKTAPFYVAYNTMLENAVAAAPTQLEGVWEDPENPGGEFGFTFRGSAYSINLFKHLFNFRRESGTFEVTGDTLTLTMLKNDPGFYPENRSVENVKPKVTAYTYTLNGGELVLLDKKNKPVYTLRKKQ